MNEVNSQDVQKAGLIITLSRRIESKMTELGATAAGIHDKTDMLSGRLSPDAVKLLHFIGAVRNRAAHEDTPVSAEDMELFSSACDAVMTDLERISKEKTQAPGNASVAPENMPDRPDVKLPPPSIVPPQPIPDVEEELKNRISRFFTVCGMIPEAHLLYLLWSLGRVTLKVLDDLLALLFGLLGIVLMIEGLRQGNHDYWLLGGIVLAAVYFYAVAVALLQEDCRKMNLFWRFAPLLNAAVFFSRGLKKLRFWELCCTAVSLAAFGYGTARILADDWKTGLALFGGSYLGSLLVLTLDRIYYSAASSAKNSSSINKFQSK